MDPEKTVYVTNREGFRNWLEKNGAEAHEIWLVLSRGAGDVGTLTYEQALEEALCFGWQGSQRAPIDAGKYAQRFTPREAGAPWSEANLARARKLAAKGRMTAAGLGVLPDDPNTKGTKDPEK